MDALPRLRSDRRGATLVEFALLSPILIALLLALVGYGQYIFTAYSLQQLANDAARAAIVGQTAANREARARASVTQALTKAPIGNPGDVGTRVSEAGGQVTVTVTVDTRVLALLRPVMIPMPQPQIERRAVAEIAALP